MNSIMSFSFGYCELVLTVIAFAADLQLFSCAPSQDGHIQG